MLRRTVYHACDCHLRTTNIVLIPIFRSFDNTRSIRLNRGKAYGNILLMVNTWHWFLDFSVLASMPCRLGDDETSWMQEGRYWEYLKSGKFLQIHAFFISNIFICNTRPKLAKH